MVRNSRLVRFGGLGACLASAAVAPALTFSNIQIQSPPMSNGSSWSISNASVSFFTPGAIVGDAVDPIRAGILSILFDATSDVGMVADQLLINLAGFTSGSGRIDFAERVIELDSGGNEVGLVGQATHTFLPDQNTIWSTTIQFDHVVHKLRVKKDFVLTAPATDAADLAALGIVNQSIHEVVPEPATLAALSLGALGVLARRRRTN